MRKRAYQRFSILAVLIVMALAAGVGYFIIHRSHAAGADINGDGTVGIADLSILASHYGQSGQAFATGDLNGDGSVGIADLSIIASAWGTTQVASACPTTPTVNIQTTDIAQSIVDAHAPGTTYLIKTGIHSGFTIAPKSGDTYCAEAGAILDGNSSVQQAFNAFPYASGGSIAGEADNVSIYGSGVSGLLEVRNYFPSNGAGNPEQRGAISVRSYVPQSHPGGSTCDAQANGWKIEYTDIHNNRNDGIIVGNNMLIAHNRIHDNATLGVDGGCFHDTKLDNNEIFNNDMTETASCDNEAGGVKFGTATNVTFNANYVHDNHCDGLWMDVGYDPKDMNIYGGNGSTNITFTNNIIVHNGDTGNATNSGSGIHQEIYGGPCTITGNYISQNDFAASIGNLRTGQIFVSNSNACIITNNTIIGRKGIDLGAFIRPCSDTLPCEITNENIHDNQLYYQGGGSGDFIALLVCDSSGTTECTTAAAGGNHFQNNHYHMSNTSAAVFFWSPGAGDLAKTAWQALGFDTTGTFDTNTTPPSQPAWSL